MQNRRHSSAKDKQVWLTDIKVDGKYMENRMEMFGEISDYFII